MDAHEHGQGGESGPGHSGAETGAAIDGRTAVLHVGGLHYASEKAVVERVLANRPGVVAVDANPVAQTATVMVAFPVNLMLFTLMVQVVAGRQSVRVPLLTVTSPYDMPLSSV